MSHYSGNPVIVRLLTLIEPVCIDAGCELVDLRLVMEQGGWVLRVCIDRPPPEGADLTQVLEGRVDLAECENVSRLLSAALDVEDPIPQAYSLEVSSPGIDRPLRTAAHFARYLGAEAKIQLSAPLATATGERRNFRGVLRGVEGELGQEHILIDVDGTRFALPLHDLDSARLVPDWDAVMRGGSGVSLPAPGASGPHGKRGQRNKGAGGRKAKHADKRGQGRTAEPGADEADAEASPASSASSNSPSPPGQPQGDASRASSTNSKDAPATGGR